MYKAEGIGKIAVLAGGPSSEKTISIKSGLAVYNALKRKGCDVKWLEIKEKDVIKKIKSITFDVAFLALHGRFGEDGTIQKILERIAVPYTGSGVMASRLALDKIASRRIFEKHRIPVPAYKTLSRQSVKALKKFSWPLIVKPQSEGSSIGLSLAKNDKEFGNACKKAFKYGDRLLIEKFIKGREIAVGILDKHALPVIEVVPKRVFYDFHAKYKDSGTEYRVPARLPGPLYRRAQALGLSAHNALGCSDFSRVDIVLDENDNMYVLEVNSIPGLTKRSLLPKAANALGIDFTELCLKLLRLAIKNRGKKR